MVDLPGLGNRPVDQLCGGRGLPAGLIGQLTGQHDGHAGRAGFSVVQAGLNVVHLVLWPTKLYHRPVNRSI